MSVWLNSIYVMRIKTLQQFAVHINVWYTLVETFVAHSFLILF